MKLEEIAKLPKNTIRVIDRTKESHYPMRWENIVHILHHDKCKSVRRYNAFLYGLCDGSKDAFPTVPERAGLKQNCGRKAIDPDVKKEQVTIGIRRSVIDSLGGMRAVQVILINHVKSLL